MENKKPNTLIHLIPDIENREPLLNTTNIESDKMNDTDDEFLKQNEVISEEIQKHNRLLNTLPMRIYRVWLLLFTLAGVIISLYCLTIVFQTFFFAHLTAKIIFWMSIGGLFVILVCPISTYGCFLLWTGIQQKDLLKVEKALLMYKLFTLFMLAPQFILIISKLVTGGINKDEVIGYFVAVGLVLINFYPIIQVRKILIKREVFAQISSFPNHYHV